MITTGPAKNVSSSPGAPAIEHRKLAVVTGRAFVLGIVSVAIQCMLTPYNDDYVGATRLAGSFFPIAATGLLLFLALIVNPLLSLARRDARLTQAEMLTVWAMMAVASGIPSSGMMRYLIPQMAAPHYFANTSNGWELTLLPHIPSVLMVSDKAAVHSYYEGLAPGHGVPWQAWITPMATWAVFAACLFTVFFCLSSLLRRRWVEQERLSFPLARVPLMLSETPEDGRRVNALLRSPLLWTAVLAVTALHTVKGMHCLWPTVPDVPVSYSTGGVFADPPLNQLHVAMTLYPLVIGLGYLVPTEVTFSIWFFFFLFQVQIVAGHFLGFNEAGPGASISMGPAYVAYQEAGGAVGLVVWLLWSMRVYLMGVWRTATRGGGIDDSGEAMPFRRMLFGLAFGLAGMFLWMTGIAAVPPLMAAVVVCGAVVVSIMVSWLVAQAGLIFVQQTFSPAEMLTVAMGNAVHFSPASCAVAALTEHGGGWYDVREESMPSLVSALYVSGEAALSARSLTKALGAALAVAFVVSAAAFIWLPYTHGGALKLEFWTFSLAPQIPLTWGVSQASAHHTGSVLTNMAAGAALVFALFAGRQAFPAFALHPAGFLVAGSYAVCTIWFSILLSWLCKSLILRYGGSRLYTGLTPLFIGLIVGDCINALIWAAVGLATHVGYSLLPG